MSDIYLDVTNKEANKGPVVEFLSRHLGVPAGEIATIGALTAFRYAKPQVKVHMHA